MSPTVESRAAQLLRPAWRGRRRPTVKGRATQLVQLGEEEGGRQRRVEQLSWSSLVRKKEVDSEGSSNSADSDSLEKVHGAGNKESSHPFEWREGSSNVQLFFGFFNFPSFFCDFVVVLLCHTVSNYPSNDQR
jgi:hypothetical protein